MAANISKNLPNKKKNEKEDLPPSISQTAVLVESAPMPEHSQQCRGHEFASNTLDDLLQSYATTGFQATHLGLAIQQIRELRQWRLSDQEIKEIPGIRNPNHEITDPNLRQQLRARIFLSFTSNQISSGIRESIRFLVQHKMVDVLITTAGGIEEDIIKCLQPTYLGDFKLSGRDLRAKGINRIGNLLVPNQNYCDFEDWFGPLLNQLHDEQDEADRAWLETAQNSKGASIPPKFSWTPSKLIRRLGQEINNEESVLYWAYKNDIPVFSPALTDGSLGDMMYFHSYKRPGFVLDIVQDIRRLNDLAVKSHATGQIILGGGLVKHHTCNANLMRNGADYSIFVNTGSEFDGSDSGASPDEAVSWGKIRLDAKPVKITADATLVFPLLVAATFAKDVDEWKESVKGTECYIDDLLERLQQEQQQEQDATSS